MTRLKVRSVIIDGEAVLCGDNGVSDFDKLHSQHYDDQAVLYAFDLIELDGEDWRSRPLEERKARLAKLLSKAGDGVYLSEHLAGDGAIIFEHACRMVLRASSPSGAIFLTARDGRNAGSRSRTRQARRP
jgi:bifunctional non-homologous end joining protein LigD